MKRFMFFAAIALVVGGIYHEEVSDYVAGLSDGSSSSGSVTSVVDSMRGMGDSGNSMMNRIGDRLGR